MSIAEIRTMDDYLARFGKVLGRKATLSLEPLHVPERDPLDFNPGGFCRRPFEPQSHVIQAASRMLDHSGSGFVVGEMGTGKTLIGMCSVHSHAKGQPYRAAVLCPDHLISKWCREIEETIPGAIVRRFDNWKGIMDLIERAPVIEKRTGNHVRCHKRHPQPEGAEWYVIGRNQAKWFPKWTGLSDDYRGFSGKTAGPISAKQVIVGSEPEVDERGRPVIGPDGLQLKRSLKDTVYRCPRCGRFAQNRKKVNASTAELGKTQHHCDAWIMEAIRDPEGKYPWKGPDRIAPAPVDYNRAFEAGRTVVRNGIVYRGVKCGEPLYNWTSQPYRWAPAWIIQRKLRRFLKYLIIDEVHEQKSSKSAQSMAAGKLMAATRHTLALTGTLIGGYARDLFPLMIRLTPETLREEGFQWGKHMEFSEVYGKIDRIVTTKQECDDGVTVGRSVTSMRRARSGRTSEDKAVRPGIMPSLFGRHLIGSSLFVALEDMAEELPDLDEYVEDGACDLPPDVADEYRRISGALENACKELLKKGSMKLLGTMLYTLLDYPDMPFAEEWYPEHEGELSVGYYEKPNNKKPENWIGVVQPAGMDRERVYPKERKLIDICLAERKEGNQVWVYTQMTGKRNVQPRLRRLLEAEGLRVGVLRADTVNLKEREEWICKNAADFDVVISHPKLVSTGLELFSKEKGGHNFSTIVFYETGYDLFTMRQASRRAWRIGQPKPCKIYYLYYRDTMQHRAMSLMSRKMAAATALEGEFSTEGLVALAGEDNAQMALARTLSERIDESDMQRNWGKVGGKKKVARPEPSPLDDLPIEVQLVAEALVESIPEPPPPPKLTLVGVEPEPDTAIAEALATVEAKDDEERELLDELAGEWTREKLAEMFRKLAVSGVSLDDL